MRRADTAHGDTVVAAWKEAASILLSKDGSGYVLVATMGTAWPTSDADLRILDAAADHSGAERPTTVAEMLIPRIVHLSTENSDEALEAGLKLMGRGRRRGLTFSRWTHTYFERLVGAWYDRRGTRATIKTNRLLGVINKLNEWNRNAEAAFYLHTDLSSDNFRPRGSPCLQYVQFRAYGTKRLSVVGMYRAHDYTNKFLGNAIGLQRLGQFVAARTGRTFTGTTIVSIHPFADSKSKLEKYVNAV